MNIRRTATAFATATTALALTTAAAPADATVSSRITVAASDTSVSSGEELVLTGRLSHGGVVRVASQDASGWTPLTGAVVHTRRDGSYRVRVILQREGERVLRVVGNPDAAGVTNSRARVTIQVG